MQQTEPNPSPANRAATTRSVLPPPVFLAPSADDPLQTVVVADLRWLGHLVARWHAIMAQARGRRGGPLAAELNSFVDQASAARRHLAAAANRIMDQEATLAGKPEWRS